MNFVIKNDTNRLVGTTHCENMDKFPEFIQKEIHLTAPNEFLKNCSTDEEKIEKMFTEANLHHERGFINDTTYMIEVFGDWKHDHLFCDDLMSVIGYINTSTTILEENGSDWYGAQRIYTKAA